MIARAPGKLVLSGAYAVLNGAPAIVTAVDRYVVADASRAATFVTEEVKAAIDAGVLDRAPWFSADALREQNPDGTSRKLGLGSSAAILVASMAAVLGEGPEKVTSIRKPIFRAALAAHRTAQGGGSGVDVAASVFGGVLWARLDPDGALTARPHRLPEGTVIEVFGSPVAAVTRDFLAKVRALEVCAPACHQALLDAVARGAVEAVEAQSVKDLVRSLSAQVEALGSLGDAADAAIVTPEVRSLRAAATAEGASFGPSGAGGGDIALFVGSAASSVAFRELASTQGLTRLELTVGAEGTHFVHEG